MKNYEKESRSLVKKLNTARKANKNNNHRLEELLYLKDNYRDLVAFLLENNRVTKEELSRFIFSRKKANEVLKKRQEVAEIQTKQNQLTKEQFDPFQFRYHVRSEEEVGSAILVTDKRVFHLKNKPIEVQYRYYVDDKGERFYTWYIGNTNLKWLFAEFNGKYKTDYVYQEMRPTKRYK